VKDLRTRGLLLRGEFGELLVRALGQGPFEAGALLVPEGFIRGEGDDVFRGAQLVKFQEEIGEQREQIRLAFGVLQDFADEALTPQFRGTFLEAQARHPGRFGDDAAESFRAGGEQVEMAVVALEPEEDLALLRHGIEIAPHGDHHPAKAGPGQGFEGEEETVPLRRGDAGIGEEFLELVDDDQYLRSWFSVLGAWLEDGFEDGLDRGGRGLGECFGNLGSAEVGFGEIWEGLDQTEERVAFGLGGEDDGAAPFLDVLVQIEARQAGLESGAGQRGFAGTAGPDHRHEGAALALALVEAALQLANLGLAPEENVRVTEIEDFETAIRCLRPKGGALGFPGIDPLIDETAQVDLEPRGEFHRLTEAVVSPGVVAFLVLEMFLDKALGEVALLDQFTQFGAVPRIGQVPVETGLVIAPVEENIRPLPTGSLQGSLHEIELPFRAGAVRIALLVLHRLAQRRAEPRPEDEHGDIDRLFPQDDIDPLLERLVRFQRQILPEHRLQKHLFPVKRLKLGEDLAGLLSFLGHVAGGGDENAQGRSGRRSIAHGRR
jgi:hypothetical protein